MSLDPLKRTYNACDPYKPAGEEYYQDCAEARGSGALAVEFQRRLRLANDHLCFLFTGHIGCGKSTELERLRRALLNPDAPHARYFPVLINVSEYLDEYDVTPVDILLAIVAEMAAAFRQELGIELKDSYFDKRLKEIKQFLLSDVEINEGDLPLWGAKVKVTRLRRDPTARQQVRDALQPGLSTMLEELNLVFDQARLALKRTNAPCGGQPSTDFVLMLDNLEKIRRVGDKPEGIESQRELFIERASQLAGLSAHVIYTVPLHLARSDGPQLEQRYDGAPFVLPMVKVIERGSHQPFRQGRDCLRAALQKRLGELPVDDAFAPDALEFLLTYSGGHVRYLMTFVQNACTYADGIPISLPAVQRAIQQTVRTYSTAIPEPHWELLAGLDRSSDQKIPGGEKAYLEMLDNLSVLEYVNGGEGDPFSSAEPWYAVHPIVRELGKFKTAAQGLAQVTPP